MIFHNERVWSTGILQTTDSGVWKPWCLILRA